MEGKFVVTETEEEINPDDDFTALCDETLIGWIRFAATRQRQANRRYRAGGPRRSGEFLGARVSLWRV
jgi:hypothetical protein